MVFPVKESGVITSFLKNSYICEGQFDKSGFKIHGFAKDVKFSGRTKLGWFQNDKLDSQKKVNENDIAQATAEMRNELNKKSKQELEKANLRN